MSLSMIFETERDPVLRWRDLPKSRLLTSRYMESILSVLSVSIVLVSLAGCSMTPPIIEEIDRAFAAKQKNEDVAAVVMKHISPGADQEKVATFLHKLRDAGFSISEYRFEGARKWPDGAVRPYSDDQTRKNMQLQNPKGTFRFVAEMQYARSYLIVTKAAVIVIVTDGVMAQHVDGRVNISGI